jgi:hypothetical protein
LTNTELKKLFEEMGKETVVEYLTEFLKCKLPKEEFVPYFKEYIDTRTPDKESCKGISLHSFTFFILDKKYGSDLDNGKPFYRYEE